MTFDSNHVTAAGTSFDGRSKPIDFEKDQETVRPYRLWNPKEGEWVRWRYYSDKQRCHIGALIEVRWSKVGTVIEVVNVANGHMIGQYRRGVNDIQFMKG